MCQVIKKVLVAFEEETQDVMIEEARAEEKKIKKLKKQPASAVVELVAELLDTH